MWNEELDFLVDYLPHLTTLSYLPSIFDLFPPLAVFVPFYSLNVNERLAFPLSILLERCSLPFTVVPPDSVPFLWTSICWTRVAWLLSLLFQFLHLDLNIHHCILPKISHPIAQ
ncbi:uncharacterized protein BDV14DRAFT_9294 [Aspergillus stella-maris]|uniref:uncharacterized protein n=1 Tax=Aspergillus stella-maris TaxID=1810926 RepID=UPI003CCDFFB6